MTQHNDVKNLLNWKQIRNIELRQNDIRNEDLGWYLNLFIEDSPV